ncbi:MAG: hypothetical protein JWN30_193 [Bacilli bacterium]|nr:hypothetical protein [Bacilli bacterium]
MPLAVGTKIVVTDGDMIGSNGVIQEADRAFLQVNEQGEFKPDGVVLMESTIQTLEVPYEFTADTLRIHYPELDLGNVRRPSTSESFRFWQHAYVVHFEGLNFRFIVYENQAKEAE